MTQHDTAHAEESEDRFYVQFDSREVELMTLDELQAAFEAGQIHENTYVCQEGESEWLTLAVVAGLGEEEEEAAPISAVERRPPMPERRPEGAAETRPAMPERRPEMNTVPAARFASQAPPVPSVVISQPAPLSYAPVTSNIDLSSLDLDDESALRPKRRWGLVLAAAAVLAIGGGGAAFALNGGGSALASALPSSAQLNAAANNSQASLSLSNLQKPAEPAAPAAPPAAEPVAAAAPAAEPTPPPAAEAKPAAGFSDEMKDALLAADKARTGKHAAKVKAQKGKAHAAAPRRSGKGVASGFKSGGSAYDPLNGKL